MRIWAPKATTLDLLVGGTDWAEGKPMERIPLTRDGDEWDVPELPHGTAYGFSIDGGPLRPDPVSAEQPWGVHGPSRVFDTSTLAWTDHGYEGVDARGAVLYEMHVGTFTPDGTFHAAIEHLDHLVELGVDIIELLPIAPFPGDRGWGYDGVSWTAVHDVYGGPAGLAEFVNACHARELGVCLDVVYNHLGPDGNYLAEFGPYFTDKHDTPWGSAINVDDDGSEGVREHILASARRWFTDFHIDALRLDAVHAIMDDSPIHILAELANQTQALAGELGRPLRLIAESDLNDPAVITPVDEGGWGMDMQWADDVHHALHSYFTGETHGYYADFDDEGALEKVYRGAFYHDGTHSTFRGSSWGHEVPASIDGHAFVVYDQNHDQVGNRAVGDRPRLTEVESLSSLALVLLSPFTPMIFQGQEWNSTSPFAFFTDHNDELGPLVSQGRLNEFATHGWEDIYGEDFHVPDPQALETFTGSKLDWAEKAENGPVLEFVKHLIQIRKGEPSFASPDRAATRLESLGERQLVLHRHSSRLVINLSDEAVSVPAGELLLTYGDVSSDITVGPGSLAVIR
ncbi:malto-oligosyltrehalose trehalohydrolase [Flaviflexus equikiangi]|uniref:malto-oligosyltrehalose trehalohydrolase n=1 Tax=Flaviflexus equikiangi TaxID=2758573 RepID=UPI002175193F|nr:malto-oligosyltrehalose trehalohydrolase [Flaviflexus equikiangi]